MTARPVPENYPRLSPYLAVDGATEAMHETFGQLDDLLLELHPPAGHARSRQSDEGAGPA